VDKRRFPVDKMRWSARFRSRACAATCG